MSALVVETRFRALWIQMPPGTEAPGSHHPPYSPQRKHPALDAKTYGATGLTGFSSSSAKGIAIASAAPTTIMATKATEAPCESFPICHGLLIFPCVACAAWGARSGPWPTLVYANVGYAVHSHRLARQVFGMFHARRSENVAGLASIGHCNLDD